MGSSRSHESLVLHDPSPVDSSVSAGGDRQSSSREIGSFTRDRSRLSPSRGRYSRGERHCAHSRSRGSHGRSRELRSCFTDRSRSRGRRRSRRDLSRYPSARAWSRHSWPWSSDNWVRSRFGNDCARVRLAITRLSVTAHGRTGPATGHVAVAGLVTALFFLRSE